MVFVEEEGKAQAFERALWMEGVYLLAIVYPTVGLGKARIRTMPSAAHSEEDLAFPLSAFERAASACSPSQRWHGQSRPW